ncbi:uncharacterized protein LOC126817380 [Patella vulgata]|uniref:uncharacterized protein LOC126817380 n=1 Tax=Patella vulgata TaxID=6465 RepID=UPI00217F790D|nr:uncharacterized protein LOC126817380 [Patella vulgata]XP_050400289.1 uncharacterized protein LOC126817380 [Patella vulgata]
MVTTRSHNNGADAVNRKTNSSKKTHAENGDLDMLSNGLNEYKENYEKLSQSKYNQFLRRFFHNTLVPVFLMLFVPNLMTFLWYTAFRCDGSYSKFISVFSGRSVFEGLNVIWNQTSLGSWTISGILIGYCIYALAMMKLLPGKMVTGPLTPKGNTPVYKDNGFLFFVVTMILFVFLTVVLKQFGLTPTIVYDRYDEVLNTLSIFSFVFCWFLYFKGLFAPSSSDSGSSGNLIFDYYWGTELYPRVFGFDIKTFTNCRFGMMVWALLVSIFALKSYELYGFVDSMFVCAVLQLIYITKFFWWESGYLRTIDIMLDRAGFYICWGCLVYIPGLYTSVSLYNVTQPVHLGPVLTTIFLTMGILSIVINYKADLQKQEVRYANGECLVWGRKPTIIRATYQLENGDVKESILLASGWWGLSRHFHYIPEIMLAFFWTVPALFNNIMPYSYVIFLVILLIHRSYRDDEKCGNKYGDYWLEYCKKVPHRIVPGLF